MPINGTNKNDHLLGTAGNDEINGGRGNDWIEGGAGNDFLTGGVGRDTFVLRLGDGNDIVSDFAIAEYDRNGRLTNDPDRILLDTRSGVWDGQIYLGPLYDGQEFYNSQGTFIATLAGGDFNGDGVTDSRFTMGDGSTLTLLSVAPDMLSSAILFGG